MAAAILDRKPERLTLAPDDRMPNSALPVIVYRRVAEGEALDLLFRETFVANGWAGLWTGAIFGYDHFHSNAHEVVGVFSGQAQLGIGGKSGVKIDVAEGDVLILPAGMGHRRIRADHDFMAVGAYPSGQEVHDIYTDLSECPNYRQRLDAVALPKQDPIYGADGALIAAWLSTRADA